MNVFPQLLEHLRSVSEKRPTKKRAQYSKRTRQHDQGTEVCADSYLSAVYVCRVRAWFATGLAFVAMVRTLHAGLATKYFTQGAPAVRKALHRL